MLQFVPDWKVCNGVHPSIQIRKILFSQIVSLLLKFEGLQIFGNCFSLF